MIVHRPSKPHTPLAGCSLAKVTSPGLWEAIENHDIRVLVYRNCGNLLRLWITPDRVWFIYDNAQADSLSFRLVTEKDWSVNSTKDSFR